MTDVVKPDLPTAEEVLRNPIINSPYEAPTHYVHIGKKGPTGFLEPGRRPSRSFVPVPPPKKGEKPDEQIPVDFDATGERIEEHALINDIRIHVGKWRHNDYPDITPVSRRLLKHWADPSRENRVLFCQREAAETAIWLTEVSEGVGQSGIRKLLAEHNLSFNEGLPRVAMKMATATGKTVVMAMLIAWQTLNKAYNPRDNRFSKRFLIVTPGITIRDRLRVLHPESAGNYYKERDLVPNELWQQLLQARIAIANYHQFLPRATREAEGVAAKTIKILRKENDANNPFEENESQMVTRVLRDLGSPNERLGEIVVINDEAHHCYRDRPGEGKADRDDRSRNDEARVWFRGLQAIQRHANFGLKYVFDLSATPYFLSGSGYGEGLLYPWTVSDFNLLDAIESGIVKIPRVPVDDDAGDDRVVYLKLWEYISGKLPKRIVKDFDYINAVLPAELEGALFSLYKSYEKSYRAWDEILRPNGEPPPVFIVVCSNTQVSRMVFEWIAGRTIEIAGYESYRPGKLALLANNDGGGQPLKRPHSILIDSVQIDSGEAFSEDFKKAASEEIERFKQQYRERNPGADPDNIKDEDLLREVMNTVGKKGTLGEDIRCVVSVSMLTEGWDANTVTHILGVRAFSTSLLCEQVVGRGLRRRSYALNDEGRFNPEYAEVYGIPFQYIPSDRSTPDPAPRAPAIDVFAVDEKVAHEIRFPKLEGYRVELPEGPIAWDFDEDSNWKVTSDSHVVTTILQGKLGPEEQVIVDRAANVREQEVAFHIAKRLLQSKFAETDEIRPWVFPQLLAATKEWMKTCLTLGPGIQLGYLLLSEVTNAAAEKVLNGIVTQEGNRQEVLRPVLRQFDLEGTTSDVRFQTHKPVLQPADFFTKTHINYVVVDSATGKNHANRVNTWEEKMALLLQRDPRVESFAKNDRLDFKIPYVHEGRTHDYIPDFLVRLIPADGDEVQRTLIVEVSGSQKSPGPTRAKADSARNLWCRSVNNLGTYGRWGYIEAKDPDRFQDVLDDAITALYDNSEITGLED
jgi:type III restriction enzyme